MENFCIKLKKDSKYCFLDYKKFGCDYLFFDVVNTVIKIINKYNSLPARDDNDIDILSYYLCKDLEGFGVSRKIKMLFDKKYPLLKIDNICNVCVLSDESEVSSWPDLPFVIIDFDNVKIDFSNLFCRCDKDEFNRKFEDENAYIVDFDIKNLLFCELHDIRDITAGIITNYIISHKTDSSKPYFYDKCEEKYFTINIPKHRIKSAKEKISSIYIMDVGGYTVDSIIKSCEYK